MKRRFFKLLLPIVAAVGMLVAVAGPAGANETNATRPWASACHTHVVWNQGAYGTMVNFQAFTGGPGNCSMYWQGIWQCGRYGIPSSYYFQGTPQINSVNISTSPVYGTQFGQACGTYSDDVVLNIWVVVSAYPSTGCWNLNAGSTWAGPGPGGSCSFS